MERLTPTSPPARPSRSPAGRASLACGLLALAALALAPSPAAGQEVVQAPLPDRPEPPPFYAIENARIVVGTGEVVERGTVVIADGLVESVGSDVEIPPEAWILDGEGLTVYPGLFDALSDLGLPAAEGGDGERGGASPFQPDRDREVATGPEDRPATYPWRTAADRLDAGDDRIETWREGGYTTALVAPGEGIVTGQGAVVSLAGEADEMVVATPAALRLSLEPPGGFRSFPGSLFGVLSYLEQLFLDVRHYGGATAAYRESPRGVSRPRYDRTLEPIHRAASEGWPVLIPGDDAVEIRRALDLGRDLGVETVVVGAQGAWQNASELAAAGAPVLVSLDWPEGPRDADPEGDEQLRALMERAYAPTAPAALEEAGVPWAFYSGGAATPKRALDGVRRAIEAGLSEEAALRGLTLGPAEIFGVADRLGTVEPGKIANLVVTDGDLFAEETEVRMTFVDGRKFELRRPERPEEPPAGDLGGAWTLTLEAPGGSEEVEAELEMDPDGSLSGSLSGSRGERPITGGWVSANSFRMESSVEMGSRTMEVTYTGTFEGGEMEGTASVGGRFSMDFLGERTGPAPDPAPRQADGEGAETPGGGPILPPAQEVLRAWAPVDWSAPAEPILIESATLWTVTGGTVEGDLLLRDGRIAAVGGDLDAPRDARVIDGTGLHVTPGLIDAHSHIAADAINEGSVNVSSMVGIEQVIDPTDVNLYREAAGGTTTSHVMHGSANPIGGKNAILKHRWGADADGLLFEGAPPTIKFALGENVKRSNFSLPQGMPRRYPGTRMGQIDVIRQAFIDAREYRARWQAWRDGGEEGVPPKRDLRLEPLVEILEGERFVHAHSYRADEILQLLRVAEELGFRIAVFQHVLEGYKVADELAAHGAGASTFSDWWAYKLEAYDAIPYNAAILTERGVEVSINSDSPEEGRHLNQEAAKTMKWGGMSEHQALAMVTINPARQLRIDDRVGSLEVGKDADVVVWQGHPLSVTAKAVTTIIDGRVVFDVEGDRERQEAIAAAKERLREALGEGEPEGGSEGGSEQEGEPEGTDDETQEVAR